MYRMRFQDCTRGNRAPPGLYRLLSQIVYPFGYTPAAGGKTKRIALPQEDEGVIGLAEPRRRGEQRIEHCLQSESRPTDHLEHIGGRGLLLQGFGKITGARLHLLKQLHVLDRDHRLIGESLQKLDVLCRKCARLDTRDTDVTDNAG